MVSLILSCFSSLREICSDTHALLKWSGNCNRNTRRRSSAGSNGMDAGAVGQITHPPERCSRPSQGRGMVLVWSMQTACIHCGTEHLLKDGEFGGHSKVQFKCSKCGKTTIVEIKRRVDSTVVMSPLPSFARANATSSNLNLLPPDPGLRL